MPPKIRQLISALKKAGFEDLGGKGSHRKFRHSSGARVTISGKLGDDAKPYQVKQIEEAIARAADENE